MTVDPISRYTSRGRRYIPGWFSRLDAELFATILLDQNARGLAGDALEIGVHHGRSFILLRLCLRSNETAIAVDVFDNQALNIGQQSGRGNLKKFRYNLDRYGGESKIEILATSSLDLSEQQVKTLTPGLRFISIDGGHWLDAVSNDLRLAAACAGDDCVIALDDLFNPDFPEVAAAYYIWLMGTPNFVPFCVTKGRVYLCRPGTERYYFDALEKNKYLWFHRKKNVEFMHHELLAFTGRYSGISGLVQSYLIYYAPTLYEKLKQWKNSSKEPSLTAAAAVDRLAAPPERMPLTDAKRNPSELARVPSK